MALGYSPSNEPIVVARPTMMNQPSVFADAFQRAAPCVVRHLEAIRRDGWEPGVLPSALLGGMSSVKGRSPLESAASVASAFIA